jgi:hypothetical protein
MTNSTSKTPPDLPKVLFQAAAAYRDTGSELPKASLLADALLEAEKAAKQQRLTYPFECLVGNWQLCFATGTREVQKRMGLIVGDGFYVPKFIAVHISFDTKGEIGNQVQLGSLLFKLTGPIKYLDKKNILAFNFTQALFSLFNFTIYNGRMGSAGSVQIDNFNDQPIAKLPFFAFFLVTKDYIAARGRGGGLAFWVREG